MNLCTLPSVKAMIDMPSDQTKHDEVLNLIVGGVSSQIERYLNRTILTSTYTEYFDVLDGASQFSVKAYPVTAVTSVVNSPAWTWTTGSSIASTSIDYTTTPGVINLYAAALAPGPGALRIIYTGGMAATVEAFEVAYPDITLAAIEQCCAVWNSRRHFGMSSASVGTQNVAPGSRALEERVVEILRPHRRVTCV